MSKKMMKGRKVTPQSLRAPAHKREIISKNIIRWNKRKEAEVDARALREAGWIVTVKPGKGKYDIIIKGSRIRNIREFGEAPYASGEPMRKPVQSISTFRQPSFIYRKYGWIH